MSQNIGERLKQARLEKGLTQAQLAEMIGVAKTTLTGYEKGGREPDLYKIEALSKALDISADELIMGDKTTSVSINANWSDPLISAYASAIRPTQEAACAVLGIPHVKPDPFYKPEVATCDMLVYTFPAAAGIPLSAEDDYERVEFPCSEVPTGADFGVRIRGDSMQPTISDDTIVFVRKQPEMQNGQIGIFMLDDGALCKRFYNRGGRIILQSDNPKYKDIEVGENERLFIVGKVLGYR